MAGKKKPQKNAAEQMQYRQQKIAKEARLLVGLPAKISPIKVNQDLAKAFKIYNKAKALNRRAGIFDLMFIPNWMVAKKVEPVITKDASPFKNWAVFAERLTKKGYKYLGSGNFSTVYAKEGSSKVIKITHNMSDSWFYYAKWANDAGWGGKYAPKMYSHKFFDKGNFAVAVMERLQPRTYSGENPDTVIEMLSRYIKNPTASLLLDLVAPGLPKFMDEAKSKFRFDDDHGSNLMVRSDGTLVWNDPVAWGACKTANDNIKTRLRAKDLAPVALAA